MDFEAIRITQAGTTLSINTSSSAATALPTCADGNIARAVRVQCTTVAYIKFGQSGVTCTTNDIMVNANFDRIFYVRGSSYFAAMTDTGNGKINVTPVEY